MDYLRLLLHKLCNDCYHHIIREVKLYKRHNKAEKGREGSRLSGNCVCNNEKHRMSFDFGAKKPENYNCALCSNQGISLKYLALEIVSTLT